MPSTHEQIIRRVYEAFNRWDIPAILGAFASDIEWVAADHSPLADHSPYRGLEAVRDGVFARIGTHFELIIRVDDLLESGDRIVMLGYYEGAPKATGRRFHAQVAHVWTLAQGKVRRFQQYTDTFQLAEALKP